MNSRTYLVDMFLCPLSRQLLPSLLLESICFIVILNGLSYAKIYEKTAIRRYVFSSFIWTGFVEFKPRKKYWLSGFYKYAYFLKTP